MTDHYDDEFFTQVALVGPAHFFAAAGRPMPSRDEEYDRQAAMVREHLDLGTLRRIAGLDRA